MLSLVKQARLKQLRSEMGYELAYGRQQGVTFNDDAEELDTLSMMRISGAVVDALNEDLESRDSPLERSEAIACIIANALKGVKSILEQDPEVAYQLGIVVQKELETALRGESDDRGKKD